MSGAVTDGLPQALRAQLRRTNFAGRTVTLAEGALVVTGTSVLVLRAGRAGDAAVLAAIGSLGLADDLLEPRRRRTGRPASKGLRGHLGALARGRVTTGALKAFGIPLLALAGTATAPAPRGPAGMALLDAALMAGCANLANLFDLRPGRALKVVLATAAAASFGPAAATRPASGRTLARAALVPTVLALPADLREHGMLGDAGANILGAAVGAAATRRLPAPARLGLLAGVLALTITSERVSFTAVIADTPALRAVDQLGRRSDGGQQ